MKTKTTTTTKTPQRITRLTTLKMSLPPPTIVKSNVTQTLKKMMKKAPTLIRKRRRNVVERKYDRDLGRKAQKVSRGMYYTLSTACTRLLLDDTSKCPKIRPVPHVHRLATTTY